MGAKLSLRMSLFLFTGCLLFMAAPVTVKGGNLQVMGGWFGDDIFPCNAGISHPPAAADVCYKPGTKTTCDPQTDIGSCLCYSSSGGDSVSAHASPIFANGTSKNYGLSSSTATNATSNSLFANSWENRIEELKFNLSSERFGTKYFVDFCYLGPIQVMVKDDSGTRDMTWGNYYITATGTLTDVILGNAAYSQIAGLNVSMEVRCDLRNHGRLWGPRVPAERAPSADIDDPDFFYSTSNMSVISSFSISTMINRSAFDVPRFCTIRYIFSETNDSALREWQIRQADVQVGIYLSK